MSFIIQFNSQKEHDEYCLEVAKKLNPKPLVIKASEFLNSKNSSNRFNEQDDEFIINNYGKLDPKKIANALGKKKQSIISRAGYLRKMGHPVFRYDTLLTKIHDKYVKEKFK